MKPYTIPRLSVLSSTGKAKAATTPAPIVGKPLQLTPIPVGKPDRELGRVVCQHIAEVTPPTVIPHNPLMEQRMRSLLRSLRIVHH